MREREDYTSKYVLPSREMTEGLDTSFHGRLGIPPVVPNRAWGRGRCYVPKKRFSQAQDRHSRERLNFLKKMGQAIARGDP
jgi:hypothetical protein